MWLSLTLWWISRSPLISLDLDERSGCAREIVLALSTKKIKDLSSNKNFKKNKDSNKFNNQDKISINKSQNNNENISTIIMNKELENEIEKDIKDELIKK